MPDWVMDVCAIAWIGVLTIVLSAVGLIVLAIAASPFVALLWLIWILARWLEVM